MSSPPVIQITSLTPSQLSEVVALSSNAMKDDTSHKAMLGENMALSDELFASMFRATLLEGEIYAIKQDGHFLSVVLWFEMTRPLFSTDAQRALGFNDFFQKLSPEMQHWWTHKYPETIAKWQPQIFTPDESKRLTWCSLLVTESTHQNQGLATSLVNAWYDQAKTKNQLVGLATAEQLNVTKYTSMGFRERGRITIDSPTGTFPIIAMSKD